MKYSSLLFRLAALCAVAAAPAALGQPANDNFVNALALSGTIATTNGNTGLPALATKETGEPNHAALPGGRSVWFTWTAPVDGVTRISTAGSQFNTLLAVYTGTAVNALTPVTSNDNFPGQGNTSRVEFNAQQGTTYRIALDGRNGSGSGAASGSYSLSVLMIGLVAILSPTNGSLAPAGVPLAINTFTYTPNPPIARVDFYRAGTLFASESLEPFNATLNDPPLGTNSLFAVMTDGAGLAWTSTVANVFVLNRGVTITSPTDGAVFLNTNAINVSAVGFLSAGVITNIEFFGDEQKFGESAVVPFNASWTTVSPGVHRLTTFGTDDSGMVHTSAPVMIAVAETLIRSNSVWKFIDNGTDQSNAWREVAFDDNGWTNGPAQLGYGDGDEATVVSYGLNPNNKYVTTYFRRAFAVSNAAAYTNLAFRVQRDDGAVVYVNGIEAGRLNMPSGTITYTTFASTAVADDGVPFIPFNAPASLLMEGTNVLAVEMHQADATSSDISFNLELLAVPAIPRNQVPAVSFVSPTNNAYFLAPSQITVEVAAQDLDGEIARVDFLVDGVKFGEATNSPYTAIWSAPATGLHTLRAVATDNEGASTATVPLMVVIYDGIGSPLVQLTRPFFGTVFQAPTNVTLAASAISPNGVLNVTFLANGNAIGEDGTAPFSAVWTNAVAGENLLAAVAYDAQGVSATSAVVRVTVLPPPDNTIAPVVFAVAPLPGASISNLTSIQVIFSERVAGVDATDLLVNGAPASSVSGGGSNYTFSVSQPAYGAVSIAWAPFHGIVDLGVPPLGCEPSSWEYALLDLLAPTITTRMPPPGATITNLTQVTVTFSEAVGRVDVSDLLINGVPASTLATSTNTAYAFGFAQPYSGPVNISWATNHGIADLAVTPNPFQAVAWSYTLDARTVLVQSNANWLFVKGTAEASTPIDAWRQSPFDDSSWSNALAPFFYGDPYNTPENPGTLLSDMQNNYTSIYLRKRFVVPNLSSVTNLFLNAQSDDGFVAWINGVEVYRFNLPAGDVPFNAVTLSSITEPNGRGAPYITYALPNPTNYLVEGENMLAVHAFNQSLTASSDFGFNAQLYTYLADASVSVPRVLAANPRPGEVLSLTNLTVTFTEPVTGVDATDLLVNGVPAFDVTRITGATYTFSFTQPPYGAVVFTWATDHGIEDLDTPPRPFDGSSPSSVFNYTLLNPGRPGIVAQTPVSGATVTNLSEITVVFSEGVTGVDAADLLVNGITALAVTSATNTTYTFTVAQPPFGPLLITWITNHGIQDLDAARNELDITRPEASWSYLLIDPVPFVILLNPPNGAVFQTPVNVSLQAGAFDNDGFIARVQFFAGTQMVGEDTNAPFAFTWLNVPAGSHTLLAVATDNHGIMSTSAPVNITVNQGATALVLSGDTWKYLDTGADQSNGWREVAFDDSTWAAGPSELGYGDTGDGRPEATVVSFGPDPNNKYVTTYFRRAFNVANPAEYTNLALRLLRDDGAAVYLNGSEIVRDNLPAGDLNYLTLALTNVLGPDEARFLSTAVDPAQLVIGTNVLAVEIHQFFVTSSSADISFNLELIANLPPVPPAVTLLAPTNNATFEAPVNIALQITASDGDGTVVRVDFYEGANKINEATAAPFNRTWTNVAVGSYVLTAVALDNSGLTATSAPVNIVVLPGPTPLVLSGSQWRYLDNGTDQSNAWRTLGFDDSAWSAGFAQLGYGDGDEATVLGFGGDPQNKFITYYFRQMFLVADPSAFITLTMDLLRDDGAVVYLNGVEVHRNNMPTGPIHYRTFAFNGTAGENTYFRTILSPASLVSGTNLIAVEIHQDDVTSSDISFDLQLTGVTTSPPLNLTRGPYLQIGTPTSATLRWRTDVPADSVVYYGTHPTNLTIVVADSVSTNEHIVQISALLPDTKYYYSVGSSTRALATGPDYWFITSPVAGTRKPTRLWVLGDSGTANNNARAVRDAYYNFAAQSRPADIWLMLGDNAYNSGTDSEYQNAVFNMYPATLRNYFLWPAIGNHETGQSYTATDFPYLHIFSLPQNGEAGGVPSGSEKYYSFDYGSIHFVCLDSMTSTRSASSPMAEWLRNDLAVTTADWVIVFFHHPPYTKGNHNSDAELDLIEVRQNLLPILEANGVDLVLSGHSHAWERSYLLHGHYGLSSTLTPEMKVDVGDGREDGTGAYRKNAAGQGVVYTVAGNGGQITGGSLNHAAHFLSLNELGSMVIDVASNRLEAIFLRSDGAIPDHFTIIKPSIDVPPPAPIALLASVLSPTEVRLLWTDTATNELGFIVERSLDGTNFATLQVLSVNVTNTIDSGLDASATYFYRVRAFNAAGNSDISNIASITPATPGAIPRTPVNLVVQAGAGPEVYRSMMVLRWRDQSTNEAGFIIERASGTSDFQPITTVAANATHYVDRNLASATVYYYRVCALNGAGHSAFSNVDGDETHPQSQIVWSGSAAVFQAGSEGVPPIRYQWRWEGIPINGETNAVLAIENVQPWDEGRYSVDITDANGRTMSNPAWLFVIEPPTIVAHPQSITNTIGSTATFSVNVSGTAPFYYQWRKDGIPIPGAVASMLVISNVQPAHAGAYDVIVDNDFDSVTSRSAQLVINLPPLAGPDTIYWFDGQGVIVELADLLANDSDTDGDPILLMHAGPSTEHGGTAEVVGRYVRYRPPDNYDGNDTFTYALSDDRGGSAVGIVSALHSDNTPPEMASVPDVLAHVLKPVMISEYVEDNGSSLAELKVTLEPGAPKGAKVMPHSKAFIWIPRRDDAPSTNWIALRAVDSGLPPLSNSTTFRIIVNDYVELTAGTAVLEAGQSGSVPLDFMSTAPLSNFICVLHYPHDRLANLSLQSLAPQLASAALVVTNDDCLAFIFITRPNQTLHGAHRMAQLHFDTLPDKGSGFVSLDIRQVGCPPAATGRTPTALMNDGEVTVIGDSPLLRAVRAPDGQFNAVLFGKPGKTYWLEATAAPHDPGSWRPIRPITLSAPSEPLSGLATDAPALFYRARE